MDIRVLMLCRDDIYSVPGGDTFQMDQTKKELEKLGLQIKIGTIGQRLLIENFDLVHIVNWEQISTIHKLILKQRRIKKPPFVLSTNFWFHTGHWYDSAIQIKPIWKLIHATLGFNTSRSIFEQWQQLKFSFQNPGRSFRKSVFMLSRLLPNSYIEINHIKSVLHIINNIEARCTIVPNGIDYDLYEPLPIPNKEFCINLGLQDFVLQVGRIQLAKNQLGLIKALYNDKSIPLVFIGQPSPYEPEYTQSCYKLAQQRGNVYFFPQKSAKELASIYVLARVHVLPSWRETPGLVSLEAAAAGCQIVTTSIGSAKEYFGDLVRYCDPRDPYSIRSGVLEALASPAPLKLRNLVLSNYTWKVAAKKTLEAYKIALETAY